MLSVDLNCDMGESFGHYSIGQDEALMDYVSSVNIACGFHGGDPLVMRNTVTLAAQRQLAIGAHPGYPDLQGFGRRSMDVPAEEVYAMVLYQVGALMLFARTSGTRLHHVKPHGALYNAAATNSSLAAAIARAVRDADPELILVGLSGSCLIQEAQNVGLRTAREVFGDRTYQDDGTLTPRSSPQALIEDPEQAAAQVLSMVKRNVVTSISGNDIPVVADTVCIHGDGKHALTLAKAIVHTLKLHHVTINRP